MEKIDLGEHTVIVSWDEVTLEMWEHYVSNVSSESEISLIDTVAAFSDFKKEELLLMPTDVFERVVSSMKFLKEELKSEPSNKVEIDGCDFVIRYLDKLKVHEYLDVNRVMENDKNNYSTFLAILCRKENELYDDDFIANKLNERIEFWKKQPITKVLPLITFFLNLSRAYMMSTQLSMVIEEARENLLECVENIESSLKITDYIIPYKVRAILTLKNIKKHLKLT